jgi:hypothetical protein
MKYLKLFEDKKLEKELKKLIPDLEEACQELKDNGFEIKIVALNFQQGNYLILTIKSPSFLINEDLINNLLFITEYAKGILKLNTNNYTYNEVSSNKIYICKYIENLPKDEKLKCISIGFTKA